MLDDVLTHAFSVVARPHYSFHCPLQKYADNIAAGLQVGGSDRVLYAAEGEGKHFFRVPTLDRLHHTKPVLGGGACVPSKRHTTVGLLDIRALSPRHDGLLLQKNKITALADGTRPPARRRFRRAHLPLPGLRGGIPPTTFRENRAACRAHAAGRRSLVVESSSPPDERPSRGWGRQIDDHIGVLARCRRGDNHHNPRRLRPLDHVDILYDIDVRAAISPKACRAARAAVPALKRRPAVPATLVEIIEDRAAPWLPTE